MLRFCSLSQKRYHRNIFTMVLYSEKRRKMITTIKMAGYINHPRPTLWRQTPREFIRTVTLGPIPPKVDQHSILLTLTFPHRLSVDEHMLQVLEQSLLVDLAKVGTLSGYLRGGASAAGRGRLPYIQRKTSARRLLPDVSVCGRLPPAACLANVNWGWLLLLLADLPTHPPTHYAISNLPRKAFLGKDFWRIDVQSWSDIEMAEEMDLSDIECCCQSGVQPTPSVEKSARERDICTTPL